MTFSIRCCHSVLFCLLLCSFTVIKATVISSLPPSFSFDWYPPGQPLPIPVSEQCETLHIQWERGANTGPNPVGPYFLQVYTSNSTVPYIIPTGDKLEFDWKVPFNPGTQYQICMFDANGNTGGCQATYSVINSTTATDCAPLPRPPQLEVSYRTDSSLVGSTYGFYDQCSNMFVIPESGEPPFTMTVAPALRPPFNLTTNDYSPFNWTITLPWGSSFFIGLFDSGGRSWSIGPLHSWGPASTSCFAALPDTSQSPDQPEIRRKTFNCESSPNDCASVLSGVVGAVLCLWLFLKFRRRRQEKEKTIHPHAYPSGYDSAAETSQRPKSGIVSRNDPPARAEVQEEGGGAVYVVHRDNGAAPIEIIVGERERVLELPPGYETRPVTEQMGSSSGQEVADRSFSYVDLTRR